MHPMASPKLSHYYDLELLISLPPPSVCWEHVCMLSTTPHAVLGAELRAPCTPDKCSTNHTMKYMPNPQAMLWATKFLSKYGYKRNHE